MRVPAITAQIARPAEPAKSGESWEFSVIAIAGPAAAKASPPSTANALVDTVREQSDAQDLGAKMRRSDQPLEMVRLAARIRRQVLERCGDIVTTFREGAAGDAEVAAAYEEGQRRTREGIGGLCSRLQAIGALRSGLTHKRAVDQVAALFSAEIFEELTGHRSGWSPQEYEEWLSDRLSELLLQPGNASEPHRTTT